MNQQTKPHSVTGDPYQVHDYDCRPLGPCPEIRLTNGAIIGTCMLPANLAAPEAIDRVPARPVDEVDQLAALRETIAFAEELGMPEDPDSDVGLAHLRGMLATVEAAADTFSPAKLGRWLGWVQGVVVAARVGGTLEDMKAISNRHKTIR